MFSSNKGKDKCLKANKMFYNFCQEYYSQRTLDKIIRLVDWHRVALDYYNQKSWGPRLTENEVLEFFNRLHNEMLEELKEYCLRTYTSSYLKGLKASGLKRIEKGFNIDMDHNVRLTFEDLKCLK